MLTRIVEFVHAVDARTEDGHTSVYHAVEAELEHMGAEEYLRLERLRDATLEFQRRIERHMMARLTPATTARAM